MKRWFITGVSGGLGAAIAHAALDRGDIVAGTMRATDHAPRFTALAPGRAFPFILDLRDGPGIAGVVEQAESESGGLDVLVNNAGYGLVGAVEETSPDEVQAQFDVNVFAPLAVMRAVLPFMRARRAGHIVNITSVSGLATWAGTGVYCASKFALEALGETLAAEVAHLGIRVTNVAPGGMRTDYASRSLKHAEATIADYDGRARQASLILAGHAGQEPGDPGKVARAILEMVDATAPPLHLVLGDDALNYVEERAAALRRDIEAWSALGRSTGFG